MTPLFAMLSPAEWILLIGSIGIFAIIAQRDYQRYKLQKAAIEKGLSVLPTGAPLWLASLKKGFLVLACGAGLITMGGIGLATLPDPKTMVQLSQGAGTATNPTTDLRQMQQRPPQPNDRLQLDDEPPPPGQGPPGPPPRGPFLRGNPPPGMNPPVGANPQGGPNQLGQGPRPFDARRDAEEGRRMCYWAIGAGGVISIVGLVLTLFAMLERKYVTPVSMNSERSPEK